MGEYYGQTTLHPFGFVAVLVLGSAMLLLPRRFAVLPMLVMACFIAPAQRLVVLTLDFNLLRIMVLFGFVRLLSRREFQGLVLRSMDCVVILWAMTNTAAYTILFATPEAFVNRLGFSFDAVGMYFLFRCLVRSWEDVDRMILGFILISIPVALFFLVEWSTGRNIFAIFGGVPAITDIREGRLRCQGAFKHPILAGCFWASLLPLMGAWWWRGAGSRWLAAVGVGSCAVIILACSSSTPVMAVIFAAIGWSLYRFRGWMRTLRWSLLGLLVLLHLLMNAPVWHLISRVNVVGGSTGWHRYNLIDKAITNVHEWWLVGIQSTAHWGYGLQDVTNQFVLEGVRGGLVTLVLFVLLIAVAIKRVGRVREAAEAAPTIYPRMLAWGLGVCLFVHITSFMAVSYFGQIIVVWYLTLGTIGGLPTHQTLPATRRVVYSRRTPHTTAPKLVTAPMT
jgi:hypothetical protein